MTIRRILKPLVVLFLALCFFSAAKAQEWPATTPVWAAKSNLLYDVTTTMNLGVEFKIAEKWTLDVPISYNPWTFSHNKKWKHILVQPESRWWACEAFSGHFFGVHAHYAFYNVGNVNIGLKFPFGVNLNNLKDYRYQGWLLGAGISYGYHWVLAPRWSLEASVGAGYAYLDYDRYECAKCGDKVGSQTKHYLGPTKAAISLIYIIK